MGDGQKKFEEDLKEDFPELFDYLEENGGDSMMGNISALMQYVNEKDMGEQIKAWFEAKSSTLENQGWFSRGKGLPRLNPNFEAALIERIQFDDDVPELRTGPLAQGVKPAVGVDTKAMNPVAIGLMLTAASEDMLKQIMAHEEERVRKALAERGVDFDQTEEEVEESATEAMAKMQDAEIMKLMGGDASTDLETYRRGEKPPLQKREGVAGSEITTLDELAQKMVWKALSTTQGRRSIANTLHRRLVDRFEEDGYWVYSSPKGKKLTTVEWTVQVQGEKDLNPNCSYTTLAENVLYKKAVAHLEEGQPIIIDVEAVNRISHREFGWALTVWETA